MQHSGKTRRSAGGGCSGAGGSRARGSRRARRVRRIPRLAAQLLVGEENWFLHECSWLRGARNRGKQFRGADKERLNTAHNELLLDALSGKTGAT